MVHDSYSACQRIARFLYGTQRFITVLTKAHHWILSWGRVRPINPYLPKIHFNVIILPTSRSSQWSSRFGLPNQNPVNISRLSHMCYMSRPPHPPRFNHRNSIRWRIQVMKFIIVRFSPWSVFLLGPYIEIYSKFRILKNQHDAFPIQNDLKQEAVGSLLFKFALECTIWEVKKIR
jgi:hypothetical protein